MKQGEQFRDKVVWITGASSGIGAALAVAFSRLGAKVILSGRRVEGLEKTRALCERNQREQQRGDIQMLAFDASDYGKAEEVVEKAYSFFARVDVFVGNAGVSQRSLFTETKAEVIHTIVNTNFLGNVFLVKAILPRMQERREGTVALVSSIVGKFGSPLRAVYSASKHALHGFCDSLAAEVRKDNITVTLVVAGFVKTDISLHALLGDGTRYEHMDENQQGGVSADECAESIIRGLARGKREIMVGITNRARLILFLHRFFPWLFRYIVQRSKVT
jgi:short-subunit dehydrogenase